MAGTPTSGALTLRAGEPFVLRVPLLANGVPQLLTGRAFSFAISRAGANDAFLTKAAVLSDDELYAEVTLTGEQSASLYGEFGSRAADYAILELIGESQITRGGDVLRVAASPATPSDQDPVTISLPYTEAIPTPAGVLITETGARGLSAAELFTIGGLDPDEPQTAAMFEALQAPAIDAAATANAAAENADDKAALAQAVVDAQAANLATIAAAVEQTGDDAEATQADRSAVAGDKTVVVAAQSDVATKAAQVAADTVTVAGDKTATAGHRTAAEIAETNAEDFATAAALAISLGTYASAAAGAAAVPNSYFWVQGSGDIALYLYKATAGVPGAALATIANKSVVDAIIASVAAGGVAGVSHKFRDEYGTVFGGLTAQGRDLFLANGLIRLEDGKISFLWGSQTASATTPLIEDNGDGTVSIGVVGHKITINTITGVTTVDGLAVDGSSLSQVGQIALGSFTGSGVRFKDTYGNVLALLGDVSSVSDFVFDGPNGILYAPDGTQIYPSATPATETFNDAYKKAFSQAAYNEVARLRARRVSPLKGRLMSSAYNLIKSYGQSNSVGTQCFPAKLLSSTVLGRTHGGLMIGNSVHANSSTGTPWVQIGSAALNPMVATVRDATTGLLDAAGQYALTPGASNLGETILEGAVATFDWLRLRGLGVASSSTKFVCYAAGVGGQTIAQLSKGASPDRYSRLTTGASLAYSLAGATLRNLATIWSQGEDDGSAATDPATWKTAFRLLRTNEHADITVGILGEAATEPMVPVFISQTCARGIVNPNGLAIANAQLELAQSDDNVFIISSYRGTKKGIHWDVNSTEWAAQRVGYVMHQYFSRGEVPFPFAPHQIQVNANKMLVSFLVPTPPLQFADAYDIANPGTITDAQYMVAYQNTNKGLYPKDATGDLTVTSVEIVEGNCLLITCNRNFGASPALDYGRRSVPLGAGNIIDSTDFQFFTHEYDVAKGYGPWESVPPFVNAALPIGFDLCLFTRSATAV